MTDNVSYFINEHELNVQWYPKIVWVYSAKFGIDPIGIKREGMTNEAALEKAVAQFLIKISTVRTVVEG